MQSRRKRASDAMGPIYTIPDRSSMRARDSYDMHRASPSGQNGSGAVESESDDGTESQHAEHGTTPQHVSPLKSPGGANAINQQRRADDNSQELMAAELDAGAAAIGNVASPGRMPANLPSCFSTLPLVFDVSKLKATQTDSGLLVKEMNQRLNSASAPLERKLPPNANLHGADSAIMHVTPMHGADRGFSLEGTSSRDPDRAQISRLFARRHTSDATGYWPTLHNGKRMHVHHALPEDAAHEEDSPYGEIEQADPVVASRQNTSQLYDEDDFLVPMGAGGQMGKRRSDVQDDALDEVESAQADPLSFAYQEQLCADHRGQHRRGVRDMHGHRVQDEIPDEYSQGVNDLEDDVAAYMRHEPDASMHEHHAYDAQYYDPAMYDDEEFEDVPEDFREEEGSYNEVGNSDDLYSMHHPQLVQQRAVGQRGSAGVLQMEAEEEAERDTIRERESMRRLHRERASGYSREDRYSSRHCRHSRSIHHHGATAAHVYVDAQDDEAEEFEEMWESAEAEDRFADHEAENDRSLRLRHQKEADRREATEHVTTPQRPPRPPRCPSGARQRTEHSADPGHPRTVLTHSADSLHSADSALPRIVASAGRLPAMPQSSSAAVHASEHYNAHTRSRQHHTQGSSPPRQQHYPHAAPCMIESDASNHHPATSPQPYTLHDSMLESDSSQENDAGGISDHQLLQQHKYIPPEHGHVDSNANAPHGTLQDALCHALGGDAAPHAAQHAVQHHGAASATVPRQATYYGAQSEGTDMSRDDKYMTAPSSTASQRAAQGHGQSGSHVEGSPGNTMQLHLQRYAERLRQQHEDEETMHEASQVGIRHSDDFQPQQPGHSSHVQRSQQAQQKGVADSGDEEQEVTHLEPRPGAGRHGHDPACMHEASDKQRSSDSPGNGSTGDSPTTGVLQHVPCHL